jgi:hypothetical protein
MDGLRCGGGFLRLRLKGARGDGLELNRPGRVPPLSPSLSCAEIITALLPLPLIHKKKSVHSPAKSSASLQPASSTRPPILGQPPAQRAVIRKPGPRACFKRRSAARLSLPRQTCRQGSGRRLQALGHCFRAAAPQAHFLLTFWGASQKVRGCKSAKQSISTGKTPVADARTTLPRSSLFLSSKKEIRTHSHQNPNLLATFLFPTLSHARTIPARRAVIRKPGPRACFKRRSAARLSLPRQTMPSGQRKALTGSWPLFSCRRTASALFAYFLGRKLKSKAL